MLSWFSLFLSEHAYITHLKKNLSLSLLYRFYLWKFIFTKLVLCLILCILSPCQYLVATAAQGHCNKWIMILFSWQDCFWHLSTLQQWWGLQRATVPPEKRATSFPSLNIRAWSCLWNKHFLQVDLWAGFSEAKPHVFPRHHLDTVTSWQKPFLRLCWIYGNIHPEWWLADTPNTEQSTRVLIFLPGLHCVNYYFH